MWARLAGGAAALAAGGASIAAARGALNTGDGIKKAGGGWRLTKRQKEWALGGAAAAVGGAALFVVARYHIAGPSTYLVRTGLGVKVPRVGRSCLQWPLQQVDVIDMRPRTFRIVIDSAMSSERIPFELPGLFVVGVEDTEAALECHVSTMVNMTDEQKENVVSAAIRGTCRMQAANMQLNTIVHNRREFQSTITKVINEDLSQFGLKLFAANLEELRDTKGAEYFKFLRERALQDAEAEARVAVADAHKTGEIGEKKSQTDARTSVAEMEKIATLAENTRKEEIAHSCAKMEVTKAETGRTVKIAQAEAEAQTQQKTAELQSKVEDARRQQQIEQLRASKLSLAVVEAEALERAAVGAANARRTAAEAELFAAQCRATATLAGMQAQAQGLRDLVGAAGGSVQRLAEWTLVERDMLKPLAQAAADAVREMKPQITYWNRADNSGDSSAASPLGELLMSAPHFLREFTRQTGFSVLPGLIVPPAPPGQPLSPAPSGPPAPPAPPAPSSPSAPRMASALGPLPPKAAPVTATSALFGPHAGASAKAVRDAGHALTAPC